MSQAELDLRIVPFLQRISTNCFVVHLMDLVKVNNAASVGHMEI